MLNVLVQSFRRHAIQAVFYMHLFLLLIGDFLVEAACLELLKLLDFFCLLLERGIVILVYPLCLLLDFFLIKSHESLRRALPGRCAFLLGLLAEESVVVGGDRAILEMGLLAWRCEYVFLCVIPLVVVLQRIGQGICPGVRLDVAHVDVAIGLQLGERGTAAHKG